MPVEAREYRIGKIFFTLQLDKSQFVFFAINLNDTALTGGRLLEQSSTWKIARDSF